MGISGLLPFVKKGSRPCSLKEFSGSVVAVDTYCWLHKGAFSCAEKLVMGEETDGYVVYVMKMVRLLLSYKIKPIMVFDGCNLPSKAGTEAKRREMRTKNRALGKELLREGRKKEARECFQRCVDVTSHMARSVMDACRAIKVDVIVAPYEADAQLAYFALAGFADLVITEDSDLLAFGCDKVIFKLDSNGNGVLVERDKLHLCMNVPQYKFSFDSFRNMCILSGCDYLPSLPGIGLAKSCKFFTRVTDQDIFNVLCKLPSYLKMPQLNVTLEYREGFLQAVSTFKYQLVFCPRERKLRPLQDPDDGSVAEGRPYAGAFVGHEKALQIALGNLDVQSGQLVGNFEEDCLLKSGEAAFRNSIWHPEFDRTNLAAVVVQSPSKSRLQAFSANNTRHPRKVTVMGLTKPKKADSKLNLRASEDVSGEDEYSTSDVLAMYELTSSCPKSDSYSCFGSRNLPGHSPMKNDCISNSSSSPPREVLTVRNPFAKTLNESVVERNDEARNKSSSHCVESDMTLCSETLDSKSGNCLSNAPNAATWQLHNLLSSKNVIIKSKYFRPNRSSSQETKLSQNFKVNTSLSRGVKSIPQLILTQRTLQRHLSDVGGLDINCDQSCDSQNGDEVCSDTLLENKADIECTTEDRILDGSGDMSICSAMSETSDKSIKELNESVCEEKLPDVSLEADAVNDKKSISTDMFIDVKNRKCIATQNETVDTVDLTGQDIIADKSPENKLQPITKKARSEFSFNSTSLPIHFLPTPKKPQNSLKSVSCRRVGLSRSASKQSFKQRSVREMFAKRNT